MDTEVENDGREDFQEPLSPRNKRMRLFLATYSLGAIVALLAGEGYRMVPNPLVVIIGTFFFLPLGIMSFFDYSSTMPMTERSPLVALLVELQSVLGMLSYLLIFLSPLFGSSTEKPRTFRLLYLLFVALVIVNVAGCVRGQ